MELMTKQGYKQTEVGFDSRGLDEIQDINWS